VEVDLLGVPGRVDLVGALDPIEGEQVQPLPLLAERDFHSLVGEDEPQVAVVVADGAVTGGKPEPSVIPNDHRPFPFPVPLDGWPCGRGMLSDQQATGEDREKASAHGPTSQRWESAWS